MELGFLPHLELLPFLFGEELDPAGPLFELRELPQRPLGAAVVFDLEAVLDGGRRLHPLFQAFGQVTHGFLLWLSPVLTPSSGRDCSPSPPARERGRARTCRNCGSRRRRRPAGTRRSGAL